MDLISLLTGSENLYKYLFIGGIGLLILSLFYPLNKRYELECQKNLHNKEIRLLNLEIASLQRDVAKLNERVNDYQNGVNKDLITKDSLKKQLADVYLKRANISKKQTEVQYNRDNINTLDKNIKDILLYEIIFRWAGIFFGLFGFFGWLRLMRLKRDTT